MISASTASSSNWIDSSDSPESGTKPVMSSGASRVVMVARSGQRLAALDDGLDLAEGSGPVDREREALLGPDGQLVVDEVVLVLRADRDRDAGAPEDLRLVEGTDQRGVLEGVGRD